MRIEPGSYGYEGSRGFSAAVGQLRAASKTHALDADLQKMRAKGFGRRPFLEEQQVYLADVRVIFILGAGDSDDADRIPLLEQDIPNCGSTFARLIFGFR